MKNENYINIQGWMIKELKLKGNELILYAIIYGFSQDGKSEFYGSIRYISEALGITQRSVISLVQKLITKKLIRRVSESHYICEEISGGEKTSPRGVKKLHLGGEESIANNNNYNNKDNNKIAEVLDIFKNNNIDISYKTIFANKTERTSALELFNSKGKNKIENIIKLYQEHISQLKKEDKRFIMRFDSPYYLLKNYEAIKMKLE